MISFQQEKFCKLHESDYKQRTADEVTFFHLWLAQNFNTLCAYGGGEMP
jgi:hypothetical protein